MWQKFIHSPSKQLFFATICVIVGASIHLINESVWMPLWAWWWLLCGLIGLLLRFRRRSIRWFAVLGLSIILLTITSYDSALSTRTELLQENFPKKTEFRGVVAGQPRQTLKSTILVMDDVYVGESTILKTQVQLITALHTNVQRGDVLTWQCAAEKVRLDSGEGYDAYLYVRKIGWRCYARGGLEIVDVRTPHVLIRFRDSVRTKVREKLLAHMKDPEAPFLTGLLIGDKDRIPPSMKEAFRETGTSHILAVSGYNVIQLVLLMTVVVVLAGFRRKSASLIAGVSITLFVLLVGSDPSVVRAGIMGTVGVTARLSERLYSGVNALLLTASVMILVNPLILAHDVGFQLSFLAVMGLQQLAKPLERRLTIVPRMLALRSTVAETMSATLMTLPLILHVFGLFAISILAVNLFVLPVIPVIMLLGLVVLFSPLSFIGIAFALASAFLLRLVIMVIEIFAWMLPGVEVKISLGVAVVMYAGVIMLWMWLTGNIQRSVRIVRNVRRWL